MSKKLGLALGSGGARGVAHIGFLQALTEADIHASCVTGCSMGAIVGACYCAGIPMDDVREQVFKLRVSRIATLNINPIKANGLFNMGKARKLLTDHLGEKTFTELEIPFQCVATDLAAGRSVWLKHGVVVDAALASSALPGVFTPIQAEGIRLVDGGVLERVPTKPLRKMGAEVVVAVDVLGNLMEKNAQYTLIDTVLRCIDIMDTRSTQSKKRARRKQVDLWLEPDLGGMDQYKVKRVQMELAYQKGYELGKQNVEKIRELLE